MDRECLCRQNATCSTMGLPKVDFEALRMPESIGQSYEALGREGDALLSGNSIQGQGIPSFSGLPGHRAASVERWGESLFGKVKDRMGGPSLEGLEGMRKKGMKDFREAVLTAYREMPPGVRSSLEELHGPENRALGEATILAQGREGSFNPQALGLPLPGVGGKKGPKALAPGHFFGNPSPPGVSEGELLEEDGGMGNLDGLDIENDDIHGPSHTSIWRILTIRYFKSAYPVIFEEKSSVLP